MQYGERINYRNDLHNGDQNVYYSPEKVVEAVCEFLSLFKSYSAVSKLIWHPV